MQKLNHKRAHEVREKQRSTETAHVAKIKRMADVAAKKRVQQIEEEWRITTELVFDQKGNGSTEKRSCGLQLDMIFYIII